MPRWIHRYFDGSERDSRSHVGDRLASGRPSGMDGILRDNSARGDCVLPILAQIPLDPLAKYWDDLSVHVRPGDRVLHVGSGYGRLTFMMAHRVGPSGHVLGVESSVLRLAQARTYLDLVSYLLCYANVSFGLGVATDLSLDLELAREWLVCNPVRTLEALERYELKCTVLRNTRPLVREDSVDVAVVAHVRDFIKPGDERRKLAGIHRALREGGRAVLPFVTRRDTKRGAPIENGKAQWMRDHVPTERDVMTRLQNAGFEGFEIVSRRPFSSELRDGIERDFITVQTFKSAGSFPLNGSSSNPFFARSNRPIFAGGLPSPTEWRWLAFSLRVEMAFRGA